MLSVPCQMMKFLLAKILIFLKKIIIIMQTEKIELETTVVDETKERESYCGQGNRRFSGEYGVNLPLTCHYFTN